MYLSIYLFSERGSEGEREGEKQNINLLPLIQALTGDRTYDPGMCPNQESNLQPFTLRDDTPTN